MHTALALLLLYGVHTGCAISFEGVTQWDRSDWVTLFWCFPLIWECGLYSSVFCIEERLFFYVYALNSFQLSSSFCLYSQTGSGDSIVVLWVYFNAHLGNDRETSGEGWLGGTACLISHTLSIMNTMIWYIVVHKCSSYQTLGKDWWSTSSTAVVSSDCSSMSYSSCSQQGRRTADHNLGYYQLVEGTQTQTQRTQSLAHLSAGVDWRVCSSCLGVTLLSLLGKEKRAIVKPQVKEQFCRFHCGHETVDQLFTLTRIPKESVEVAHPASIFLVDLEKDFDHVPWGVLSGLQWEYGVPRPLLFCGQNS